MIFQAPELTDSEGAVVAKIDGLRVRLSHSTGEPRRWFGLLRRTSFAKAIQGSNTIEGINITIDDAIAAVEREVPQEASSETWRAIEGYREAMTYVLSMARQVEYAYSADTLKSLHFMMLNYDLDKGPGQWRPGEIFIRRESDGEIVYTGPSAELVPKLMTELVANLNSEDGVHPLVRAAMAHLNLTMIHPFKDGNGRMARCLQSLVLARTVGLSPVFSSIEEYLGRNTLEYYRVLEQVGAGGWHPERDARPWIRFCLTAHFRQATTFLRRIERIGAIWDELETLIGARGLPERTIFALADATVGLQVRNPLYRKAADITDGLASRDLRSLVNAGLLLPVGERRGRYYVAGSELKELNQKHPMEKRVADPFEQLEAADDQPRLPGI
jgi:Fic family protein